jgi:hypothetical protein
MITFSLFGKPGGGRLGNSLWQLASLIGFCGKYNCEMQVPQWFYSKFFMYPPAQYDTPPSPNMVLVEPDFHYTPEFWDAHAEDFKNKVVDIRGWLQSYKYFEQFKDKIKERMAFTHELSFSVKQKFIDVFTKPTIAISIRRGDYVGNPNYELLPINYYIGALFNNFSDQQNYNILIFSDDLSYCKTHFQCLPNVFFADGLSDIEQLCLMSQCDNFILANSTFSFWGAFLGEKPYSKIVRPNYHFAGELLAQSDWKDYYPPHWIVYDHRDGEINKIDLPDVTFCIPVFLDHPDRHTNIMLNICMLKREFNCKILIGEQGGEHLKGMEGVDYVNFPDLKEFHRTKMLNEMMASVNTPIVYNWDADVVIPPLQILQSIKLLRENKADMVYPYDGRFARVARNWVSQLEQHLDVGILGGVVFKGMRPADAPSVGGAMAWTKKVFIEGGMENENFISYAPEDRERCERFTRLGYRVIRIPGILYHIDHFISIDSSEQHPRFNANWDEYRKEIAMTDAELKNYVKSWSWVK